MECIPFGIASYHAKIQNSYATLVNFLLKTKSFLKNSKHGTIKKIQKLYDKIENKNEYKQLLMPTV